jgi:hypothetical protein
LKILQSAKAEQTLWIFDALPLHILAPFALEAFGNTILEFSELLLGPPIVKFGEQFFDKA